MDFNFWNIVGSAGFVLVSIVGAVWSMAIWLGRQFSTLSKAIVETKDAIIAKLEYHERHDDTRFSEIHKDIWEIRLRNAAIDAAAAAEAKLTKKLIEKQKENTNE